MNQSKYQIGNFENNKLVGERYLSQKEHQDFIESDFFLRKCSHTIDLYNFVINNFNDLIEYEEKESKILSEVKYGIAISKSKKFYLDLNRLLLNYFSIVKSFLDYLETDFKRTYGKGTVQVKSFKNVLSYCFDNSFAYRFFYKLRNYAQHIDLPINDIKLNAKRVSPDKVIHFPKILFSKKELLSKFDEWGAIVKKDLEEKEEEFEVFNLLQEHIESIKFIYKEVVKIRKNEISNSVSFLDNLTKEYREKYKTICIFKSTPIYDNEKLIKENIELQSVQLHLIDYFKNKKEYGG